ncbi:Transmembrane protein 208 [Tetrabaena socialis]|uniref:Transmembrane protein 208 n=1 Tax=Tetrabaena socialis TaxID=47790 RepID=A0A2J8A965_9CHLO|nr:Transmembrane protein 208 [Tetrabaena socialis]|eukprot:PNH09059.1 Transmembrane protein 208 [Tetrabaena socialis]
MAKQGPKKQVEENKKRLRNLRYAIAVGIAIYVLIRLLLRQGFRSQWHVLGAFATIIPEVFCYSAIAKYAEAEYNEGGEVVYGGADLSMGGMCAYWHDALFVVIFVQGAYTNPA